MTYFTAPEVTTDRLQIKAKAVATMEENLPGWTLVPGSPEDAIFDAWAQVASEHAEVLVSQLMSAFRSLGGLFGVTPIEAQPALALATFTTIDTTGYTLEVGSVVLGIRDASGQLQAFRLMEPITIAPGSSTGAAYVEALERGEAANNLAGVAQLIEAPPSVASASLAASGGGLEAEEDQTFLNRLAETLALIKPGPVKAADAATLARSIPGIGRATAVDNLKPSAADGGEGVEESNVEKCVTVAVTDINGVPSDASHIAAVKASLEAEREDNFVFYVVKPHIIEVDVSVRVVAWPGHELTAVEAAVREAIMEALSPARYATDASGLAARWANDPVVHSATIYNAISRVGSVRYATELLFGPHGGALSTKLTLGEGSKVPALPKPITVSVVAEPST